MPSSFPHRARCTVYAAALFCLPLFASTAARAGQGTPTPAVLVRADAEPDAAQLKALANAAEAELWLEQAIPPGFTVGEAPAFFEAADEVFFNAEEGLLIFAYRSAVTGKWIAWVAFDGARSGVVHTAGIDLKD